MKFACALVVALALGAEGWTAPTCKPRQSPDVHGRKVCLGKYMYAEYTDAPDPCALLSLVPKGTLQTFSSNYYSRRVGMPKWCASPGSTTCFGTETKCGKVSHYYSPAVKFYIDRNMFQAGDYEIRMYRYYAGPEASYDIELVDCDNTPAPTPMPTPMPTPAPTPAPTPVPTPAPPTHTCVEADPPLTYTKVDTVEMMEGWSDCSHNLKHVPSEWTQPDAFTCKGTSHVPEGTTFTLKCPENSEYPCDWFVTHYHCPPCSGSKNGGWPAILTTEGWERGSCGPRIATPFQHETAVYRRQVAPGESVLMGPSVKPTKYMTFHMMPGANCESMSQFNCDTNSFCAVVEGKCTSYWCPRRLLPSPGPNPCQGACLDTCE